MTDTTINTLHQQAAQAAQAAAQAADAVEQAQADQAAETAKRERAFDLKRLEDFSHDKLQNEEKKAWAAFESAVAKGKPGVEEWTRYRVARALHMQLNREARALAERLQVTPPWAPDIGPGPERFTDAIEQAIGKSIRNRVADVLDQRDAEREAFLNGGSNG